MKSIFNSLGSNYSLTFVSKSLWSIVGSKKTDIKKLEKLLREKYEGKLDKDQDLTTEVITLYKGRDAIEAALKVLLKRGDKVITQAFSCYAVEEGITRAGMKPVYADISKDSSNLTVSTIEKIYKKNKTAKAVLVQHSLGVSADTVAIKKWCDENGLLLIEDVAQGIGGVDREGKVLGETADAVILSFGKDKIIDAISGGAVVFRKVNPELREAIWDLKEDIANIPFVYVYEDLIYPDITSFIRRTHHIVLGKILLVLVKYLGLLGSPIKSKTDELAFMHPAYAKLALYQFQYLEKQLLHRRRMALEYYKQLKSSGLGFLYDAVEIKHSSNLRFSIRCRNYSEVEDLMAVLKKNKVHVSDRWYRKAVDCGSFKCSSVYEKDSCPNAESLATKILNLPTHREMDLRKVRKICKVILENT